MNMNPFVICEPTFNENNDHEPIFCCRMKRFTFVSIFAIVNRFRKGLQFMIAFRLACRLLRIKIGLIFVR